MAQVDTSIYNALLQRPKSVIEWQNEYAAQDDAAQARQLNALNMREAQARAGDASMARQDQWAVRNALSGMQPDAPMQDRVKTLRGTGTPLGYTQAQELEKADLEAAKVRAQTQQAEQAAASSRMSAEAAQAKAAIEKHDRAIGEIMSFQSPQEAMESLRRHAAEGSIGQAEVQSMSRQLMGLSTPEQWQQWQDQTLYKLQDAKGKAELTMKRLEWTAKQRESASTLANRDLIEDPTQPGRFIVNAPLDAAKVRRAQASAPVTMGAPVAGIDTRTGQPAFFQPGNRPGVAPQIVPDIAPAPKKGEGMSATLQKELVEADDLAQNSSNVGDALRRALSINDKAYSGYQATARAKVRSNLPGQDASADATIELENLIAGQGLESLRAIFGGNPTEGERKILLDLQASTDKTPAQRKAIIERAIQAADKRQQFAKNRAEAIRSGTYLSQGAAPVSAPAQPAAPAGQPRVINFGDLQ